MMRPPLLLALLWLVALPALAQEASEREPPREAPAAEAQAAPQPPSAVEAAAVFDQLVKLVDEHFYDPHFGGRDWTAIAAAYRPQVVAATTPAERQAITQRMLAELGASHISYLTPGDPAYYDLADIFAGALRHELPRFFPKGEAAYDGIGMVTTASQGKIFVSGLFGGFPAEQSGIRTGDEIVAADGNPFDPIASLAGKAGAPVHLTVRRTRDGATEEIAVTPQRIRPNEAFLAAIKASARIILRDGRKIGAVHMWSFGRREDERAFEEAISAGPLKDADALVWDLRDGWGGTATPDDLDVFDPRGPIMTVTNRAGESHFVTVKWRKPVVLLVNGGTRSAKEILAYGFKKYGYGPVVGTRTSGSVLAASAFMLGDGTLLELPVDDVRVDGERLEGIGVTPTIEVPFTLEYSAGADPQLDRAVAIAAEAVRG